ncbi:MAG: HD domain-containing protein [Thermoanaerobaculia bacterium]|nr:HD domain-containing protein [Thermoanaerobaculia bacterium]
MLSLRDPIHGFIRADPLEAALVNSRAVQRLRGIKQLGMTFLVFPGAEHSRFGHALGTMHLAGRVYDALAARDESPLEPGLEARDRRRVRVAGLLHDIGHAPFSHSAEELFDAPIDHEEMTRRLLEHPEIEEIFSVRGGGLAAEDVLPLLSGGETPEEHLLAQIISGELDCDKMDYLLRDSLFCGVAYGSYDLERLLDTVRPLEDPKTGEWGIGVDEGGVHALEALVMARYYMFTQVYFNVTGKVLEHHLNAWLLDEDLRWPSDPERFLSVDDVATLARMRESDNRHARAVLYRERFPLAYETREHLTPEAKRRFEELLPELRSTFGARELLVSNSAKDPHRLGSSRVLVRRWNGELEPMERASHFIRHLTRIDTYRVYAAPEIRKEVSRWLRERRRSPTEAVRV